jgi:hypothetical protein|tara:strand:+ start:251 stop:487 length:237 start_codon:yes stop_codon:yes gene_type:complete
MDKYKKQVTISEGPFERIGFPNGVETKNVLSRQMKTIYVQDGYLCESIVDREYRDGDYHDTTKNIRVIKLNDNKHISS